MRRKNKKRDGPRHTIITAHDDDDEAGRLQHQRAHNKERGEEKSSTQVVHISPDLIIPGIVLAAVVR